MILLITSYFLLIQTSLILKKWIWMSPVNFLAAHCKWVIEAAYQRGDMGGEVTPKTLHTCVLEAVRTQCQGQWNYSDKGSLHMYYVRRAPISQIWSVICFQQQCWPTGVLLPCIIHLNIKDKLSSVNHCLRALRVKKGICGFGIVFLYGKGKSRLTISTCQYNFVNKICVVKVVFRGCLLWYEKNF